MWVRRACEAGDRSARKQRQPRCSKLDPHRGNLLGLIAETSDLTISDPLHPHIGKIDDTFDGRDFAIARDQHRARDVAVPVGVDFKAQSFDETAAKVRCSADG